MCVIFEKFTFLNGNINKKKNLIYKAPYGRTFRGAGGSGSRSDV